MMRLFVGVLVGGLFFFSYAVAQVNVVIVPDPPYEGPFVDEELMELLDANEPPGRQIASSRTTEEYMGRRSPRRMGDFAPHYYHYFDGRMEDDGIVRHYLRLLLAYSPDVDGDIQVWPGSSGSRENFPSSQGQVDWMNSDGRELVGHWYYYELPEIVLIALSRDERRYFPISNAERTLTALTVMGEDIRIYGAQIEAETGQVFLPPAPPPVEKPPAPAVVDKPEPPEVPEPSARREELWPPDDDDYNPMD